MARTGFALKYFTPAIKPRLKPTFAPHISATGISGVHFKPRVLPTPLAGATSAIRTPRISGSISAGPARLAGPKLKTMLTQSSSGQPAKPNPTPKTQTGITTQPSTRAYKPPSSMAAQRPGVHTLQGAKMKVRQANPLRPPRIPGVGRL